MVLKCLIALSMLFSFALSTCDCDLLIDDFSFYSLHTNNLGLWTGDDGTVPSISSANNTLTFKPTSESYIYTDLPCLASLNESYNALFFSISGPRHGTVTIDLRTKDSCSSPTYSTFSRRIGTLQGYTDRFENMVVPLSWFGSQGANLDAVTAVVGKFFGPQTSKGKDEETTWQLREVKMGCAGSVGFGKDFIDRTEKGQGQGQMRFGQAVAAGMQEPEDD